MTIQEIEQLKKDNDLIGVYFKSPQCGVCGALLPRIEETFNHHKVSLEVIDITQSQELIGHEMVMNVPVLKVFHRQRQAFKEGAYMDIKKVGQLLFQYSMLPSKQTE